MSTPVAFHIALPDAIDQKIIVNGREWRFDFHRYLGPDWLKKNGEPRKCQCLANCPMCGTPTEVRTKVERPEPSRLEIAAMAMQGMLAASGYESARLASCALHHADALIAAAKGGAE